MRDFILHLCFNFFKLCLIFKLLWNKKFWDIASGYDVIILDAYGVFTFSDGIAAEAVAVMKALREAGKMVLILSNSSAGAVNTQTKYAKKGLLKGVHYDAVMTSGEYGNKVAQQGALPVKGTKMYVFGTANFKRPDDKLPDMFKGAIYSVTEDISEADFIYAGIPQINYQDRIMLEDFIPEIKKCLVSGLPMVCCNPDLRANEGGWFVVRPGLIVKTYQALGGKVYLYGKPDPQIFDFLLQGVNVDRSKMLMEGDTLGTDILGHKEPELLRA